MIKALVEYFIKTLVTQPDKVLVTIRTEQDKNIVGVFVAPEDRGRAIGKDGKTIRAIRQCVESLSNNEQFVIDFVDARQQNTPES